jgi:hypothetical protein
MPQVSAFPDDQPKEAGTSAGASLGIVPSRHSGISAFPEETEDRLRDGLAKGPTVGADSAARAFNLQLKTGLPVDVIRRNLDAIETEVAKNDFDPAAFRQRAPKLAGWIEQDPLHGALVHDDIVPLTGIEQALNFGTNALGSLAGGFLEHANLGLYGVAEAAGDVFGVKELTDWGKRKGTEAQQVGQQFRGAQAGVGRTGRAVLSGFESIGAAAPILVSTLITKNPTAALALMGLQTGGASYHEARGEGLSTGAALAYGTIQGAVEAGTEKLPLEALVGDLAAKSGLLKTLAHQLVTEIPGEELATALQDLNDWAFRNPNKPFASYLAERPGAFWDTFVSTVVASGVQTGAMHGLDRLISGGPKQQLEDLGRAVAESKTATRSPEKFEEAVQALASHPEAALYAPLESFTQYWQSKGLDPAQVAAELTGSATAYQEAQQTGADLRIPVGRYATRLAGTEHNAFFANELRLDPAGKNGRELEAFLQEQRTAATAAKPEVTTSEDAGGAQGVPRETVEPRAAAVEARVQNVLESAGVTKSVAGAYARIYRAVFGEGLVARAGLDPVQAFERYGLTFQRQADPLAGQRAAAAVASRTAAARPAGGTVATASTVAPATDQTTPPAGALAGLEDVAGLSEVLAGLGDATLTEAPTGSQETNASGESEASLEALRRQEGMQARGERFVVYNRAGTARPLLGPEAVDYRPAPGETYGVETAHGFRLLEDRGGRPPRESVGSARGTEAGDGEGGRRAERGGADANRSPQGGGDGGVAERRRLPTRVELAAAEGAQTFTPQSPDVDKARFTPEHTRELERIADELEEFGAQGRTWSWLSAADRKTGNAAGGGADVVAGAAGAPVLHDILEYAPLNKGRKADAAKTVAGTRTQVAAAIRKALSSERITSNLAEGAMRVAERRAADDYRDISRPSLPPSWGTPVDETFTTEVSKSIDEELDRLELDAKDLEGVGDLTFDPTQFEQRDLFPAEPTVDTLDTGEQQPRLPGDVGAVRDLEIPLPEFEAPFALTSEVAKPERGKPRAPAGPSPEYVAADRAATAASRAFAEATKQYRAGQIDDATFLEARATNETARKAFDEAFDREAARNRAQGTTLFQKAPEARGSILFGKDRKFSIELYANADLSTVLHESGHFFLEVFADVANEVARVPVGERTEAQQQILGDMAALEAWFGDEERAPAAGSQFTTQQHEKFARAFEGYLFEGKAPTDELRSIFDRFKQWFTQIYRSLTGLERAAGQRLDLNPEVRAIFDRLLASDTQIAAMGREVVPIFTTAADAGMTEAEFAPYRAAVERAHLAAKEQLDARLARDVQRQRTAQWKAEREAIEERVVAELNEAPIYRALAAMQTGTLPDGTPIEVDGTAIEPIKLSRKLLVEQFGKDAQIPRGIASSEGGLDPRTAAELFGFSSADAMLNELRAARPYAEVIEAETNQRMIAQHGDTLLDGSIIDARQTAAASEDREILVRAELRALRDLQRQVSPHVGQAVEQATREAQRERDYERRWFEAEAKLRIAIAEGRKQTEIDALRAEVKSLKAKAKRVAPAIIDGIPNAAALREAARIRVGATPLDQLNAERWYQAAKRASREATLAAARDQVDKAITAKTQELLALAIYREAKTQLETLERRVDTARGLAKPAVRAKLTFAGESYLDQIDGVLDRFEFAKVSERVLRRRAGFAKWVAALEGERLPTDFPEELLDEARRTNYRKLTVDELGAVLDGIDQILHLARLKNQLLTVQAKRELDAEATSLGQSIRDRARHPKREVARDRRLSSERARLMDAFFGSHRKLASLIREMDGFTDGGPLWEVTTRPLNAAGDREAVMNSAAAETLHALVEQAFPGTDKAALYEKTEIRSVNRSMSRMERILVALNWGNEGNRDRVRRGERWTDRQVQDILDTLTKRDLDFVQGIFDFFESYRPEMAAKQKRVYGVEPEWVESSTIRAAAGEIPGGYFPIKDDDRLSAAAVRKLDLEGANLAKNAAVVQATTRRGHLKERAATGKARVRLDFGVIFEHTQQVIHDLTHHEALIDVGRLLGHNEVSAAIIDAYGDQVYKELLGHVRDIAFGDIPATDAFERGLNHLRTGATIVGLGWNVGSALIQPLGLLPGMQRVGVVPVLKGVGRWIRDTVHLESTVGWVQDKSAFMRLRSKTQQREINEIRNAINVSTGRFSAAVDAAFQWGSFGTVDRQAIADSYFFLIGRAQMMADIPIWLGAYEKAIAATPSDDARAVALADQAVLDTQGGGQIKDLASVQKGGPAKKLWTNFYSQFNVLYNQAVEAKRATRLSNPIEVGRLAADYFLLFIAPASLGYLLAYGLHAGGGGDDKESFLEGLARSNVSYPMGTMLGLREISGAVEGYAGYEGPAGARAFATLGKLARQTGQIVESGFDPRTLDAAFWRSLTDSAGVWFHFPTGQTRRSLEGLSALIEGKTDNPAAVISGAPR